MIYLFIWVLILLLSSLLLVYWSHMKKSWAEPTAQSQVLPLLLQDAFLSHQHQMQTSAQHSTAQHSTAQHSTAQHSTAQHSIACRCPQGLLTLRSWIAFCLLAVPRKATRTVSCPQATRHLVLVKGSLTNSRWSKLYSCIAVSFGTSSPCSTNKRTTFVPIWSRDPSLTQDVPSVTVASPSLLALPVPAVK